MPKPKTEQRLTEEQIDSLERSIGLYMPWAVQALRQVRGGNQWLIHRLRELGLLDQVIDDNNRPAWAELIKRDMPALAALQAERDVAREQAAMLQTMLRAEHSPHAEWIGCRTCASLANLPAAVQRHLERDKVAEDIAEELWNFRVALQGQGLTNLLQKLAAYRAAGGEESK